MKLFENNEEIYEMFNKQNEKFMIFIECCNKKDCIKFIEDILRDFGLMTKENMTKLEYYEKNKRYNKYKLQKKIVDLLDFINKKDLKYKDNKKNYNIFIKGGKENE